MAERLRLIDPNKHPVIAWVAKIGSIALVVGGALALAEHIDDTYDHRVIDTTASPDAVSDAETLASEQYAAQSTWYGPFFNFLRSAEVLPSVDAEDLAYVSLQANYSSPDQLASAITGVDINGPDYDTTTPPNDLGNALRIQLDGRPASAGTLVVVPKDYVTGDVQTISPVCQGTGDAAICTVG